MPEPHIIWRNEWSDVHPTWTDLVLPTPKAVLHHQGGTFTSSANLEDLKARLRAIEHGEMGRGDGLIAIAYHWWVVNGGPFDGLIFELRPIGKQGGATYHQNAVSHAVCVSGDFTYDTLTDKAFASVIYLFAKMELKGFITKGAGITPHSIYFATACPGVKLRARLVDLNTALTKALNPTYPVKVTPMYHLNIKDAVDDLACPTGGAWVLQSDGGIFSFGGAPFLGSMAGDPDFAGRTAARLRLERYGLLRRKFRYVVIATSTEEYRPKLP